MAAYLHAGFHDQPPLPLREYCDWDWLRYWLKDTTAVTHGHQWSPWEVLKNVRVIDVSQSCVVQLPFDSEYVTLSYVWGTNSEGQFQALSSNIKSLETPSSLESIDLPLTISDAMVACKKLRYRYLWVDRLCIIQDESATEKQIQLDQMGNLYHRAALTLVAGAGKDPTHGLPGVSRPKEAKQRIFSFDESFQLVECIPSLNACLSYGEWQKRAWTFQEYLASSTLLIFTDYGLFLETNGVDGTREIHAEGPARSSYSDAGHDYLTKLERYSRKTLTYPADILRAFSGIVFAMYGNRASFGMPWDEFDHALLWTPTDHPRKPRESQTTESFPTWSWTSANSPVDFDEKRNNVYSLAYWGRAASPTSSTTKPLQWQAIEPSNIPFKSPPNLTIGALAWEHGCIRSEVPECLLVAQDDILLARRIPELLGGNIVRQRQYWITGYC
ncbi:Nn.00g071910.m01.CDS01 [Neocucurbitaria sp. VM-36]